MSASVVPPFDQFPDPQAAEAFSEALIRLNDFKVQTVGDSDPNAPFPPVPAHLTAICSAYSEMGPEGPKLRRQFSLVDTSKDPRTKLASAEAFTTAYGLEIGHLHESAQIFQSGYLRNVGNVAVRATELAQEASLRTVASFVLFTAASTGETFTGLLIPRLTFETLPLENREFFLDLLRGFQGSDIDPFDYLPPKVKEIVQGVLRNDPQFGMFPFMAAAMNLPDVETVSRTVRASVSEPRVVAPPKENRAARRARQAREGRHPKES